MADSCQRLLGVGSIEPAVEALRAALAVEGRSLGGRKEAKCSAKEALGVLRTLADARACEGGDVDGAVGPTSLDLQAVEWLHALDRPITYVATKADKVKPSKSKKRRTELTEKLGVAKADVTWVSAEKGTGIPELRQTIRTLLGAS